MSELDKAVLPTWVDWNAPLLERPRLVKVLSAGTSHRSFLVSGASAEGHDLQFVVRLDNPGSRSLAASLSQEISAMQLAHRVAPGVVYHNRNVLVTHYVSAPHWRAGEHLPRIGNALAELHCLPPPTDANRLNLVLHCNGYRRRLGDLAPHQPLYEAGLQWMLQTQHRYPESSLCHNDLNPNNLLVDEHQLVFIDWEYSAVNSPWFDLASLVEFGQLSNSQMELLCRNYGDEKKLADALRATQAYRPIVRLLEWLWLSIQDNEAAINSRERLRSLLTPDA